MTVSEDLKVTRKKIADEQQVSGSEFYMIRVLF